MARRLLASSCLLLLTACTVHTEYPVVPNLRANVSETLSLKLAAATVPGVIRAMQGDSAIDDAHVSMQITPSIPPRSTVALQSEAYVLALADARAKAGAIAERLGVPLGAVISVAEIVPNARGGYSSAGPVANGLAAERVMVQAPSNGIVTLAVTFNAGSSPISVFGVQAGAPPPTALSDADGVWVSIQARGESFAIAGRRMRSVEAAVRSIAQRYRAATVVTNAAANTY
jgi:hypothetical protein